jgi:hypothetical protein
MYARIRRLHAATDRFGDLGLLHETFESDFESTLDQALQLGTEPGRQVGPYSAWLREVLLPKLKAIAETRGLLHYAYLASLDVAITCAPSPCDRLSRSPWWDVAPTTTMGTPSP